LPLPCRWPMNAIGRQAGTVSEVLSFLEYIGSGLQ
jgi:hypothetical protein